MNNNGKFNYKIQYSVKTNRVKSLQFNQNLNQLLISLYSGDVEIYDYFKGSIVHSIKICNRPLRVARYINSDRIVCGNDEGSVYLYDLNASSTLWESKIHTDFIRDIQIVSKDRIVYFLSCGDDGWVYQYRIDQNICVKVQEVEAHQDFVMQLALNPKDSNMFASCGMDKLVSIFNMDTFSCYKLKGHVNGVCAIAFSGPKVIDPLLISGSDDLSVIIHDYLNRTNLKTIQKAHNSSINGIMFIPNTNFFMSCSEDYCIKFYDMEAGSILNTVDPGLERGWCMASKQNLIACGFDQGFQVWELKDENTQVGMHSNGRVLYKLKGDAKLSQGNLKTVIKQGKSSAKIDDCTKHLSNVDYEVDKIQYSIDGKYIFLITNQNVSIYNAQSFKLMRSYEGYQLCQNTQDTQFAILNFSKQLVIYGKATEKILNLPGDDVILYDGSLLTLKFRNEVYFYEWDNLKLVHKSNINADSITFNNDGTLVAMVTNKQTLIMYINFQVIADYLEDYNPQKPLPSGVFEVITILNTSISTCYFVENALFYFDSSLNEFLFNMAEDRVSLLTLKGEEDKNVCIIGYCSDHLVYYDYSNCTLNFVAIAANFLKLMLSLYNEDVDQSKALFDSLDAHFKEKAIKLMVKIPSYKQFAFDNTKDLSLKVELAIDLNRLEEAYSSVIESIKLNKNSLVSSESKLSSFQYEKLSIISDYSIKNGKFDIAIECCKILKDYNNLFMIATCLEDDELLDYVTKECKSNGVQSNLQFISNTLLNKMEDNYDLIKDDEMNKIIFQTVYGIKGD